MKNSLSRVFSSGFAFGVGGGSGCGFRDPNPQPLSHQPYGAFQRLQGYLAHTKQRPPRTLQQAYA